MLSRGACRVQRQPGLAWASRGPHNPVGRAGVGTHGLCGVLNAVTEKHRNIFEAEGKYVIPKMGASGSFKRRLGMRSAAKARKGMAR